MVVFVSDHGEAFGEHGDYYHGHNMYDESTRVPMLWSVPGLAPRRLGQAPVSLLDLAPTLLNLAGLAPLPGTRGHDLTGALVSGELALDRHVFIEADYPREGYKVAVVTRDRKLIQETRSRTLLLYDLDADPI